MIFNYLPEPSIAPLAYCLRVGIRSIDVVHGTMVATTPNFFHDDAWDGDFTSGGFDTSYNCGTGGMLVGEPTLRLVTPEMPIECLFLFDDSDATFASNSFAFLMEVLDDQLDVNHSRYRDEMMAVERGVRLGSTTLTTAGGRSIRILFDETADIGGPGDVTIRPRPLSEPFPSWSEYRRRLSDTVAAVIANAADPSRPHHFEPLVTMSTGYDSCAVAALAAEAGVVEGVTMMRFNSDGTEPVDYPGAVASTLGLKLHELERDRWRNRTDLPEAEVAASMTTMGAVSLLALDDRIAGRLVLTGSSGDTVWSRDNYRYFDDVVHGYGHLGERGLIEHRLHVGYIRFSPPDIAHTAHRSIFALSTSRELAPWSIGGTYDRPIARRIIEEAGVQRGTFAVRKFGASAKVGHSRARYRQVGRSEMADDLSEIMSPPAVDSFLDFLSGIDLETHRRCMSVDALGYRLNQKLDALNHRIGMRLHTVGIRYVVPRRVMRWLGRRSTINADYTRWLPHWGVSKMRAGYRSGAATLATSVEEGTEVDPGSSRRASLTNVPTGSHNVKKRVRKKSNLQLTRRILGEVWRHPNNRDHRLRAMIRAVSWQVYKRLSGRPKEITVYGGYRLKAQPSSDSASNLFYFGDRYDQDEMTFLERYLRPGDSFIDVGANIGTYSLFAASLVGETGRVDAFEPVPQLARWFRETVALNGLENVISLQEVATVDRVGTIGFRPQLDVSSRVACEADSDQSVVEVPCTTLDAALPEGRTYAVAKVDVEGAETATLRGATQHLLAANPPVVLMEVLGGQLERQGSSREEALGLLGEAGYDLATFSSATNRLTWLDPIAIPSGNIVAVARRHRAELEERLG